MQLTFSVNKKNKNLKIKKKITENLQIKKLLSYGGAAY